MKNPFIKIQKIDSKDSSDFLLLSIDIRIITNSGANGINKYF